MDNVFRRIWLVVLLIPQSSATANITNVDSSEDSDINNLLFVIPNIGTSLAEQQITDRLGNHLLSAKSTQVLDLSVKTGETDASDIIQNQLQSERFQSSLEEQNETFANIFFGLAKDRHLHSKQNFNRFGSIYNQMPGGIGNQIGGDSPQEAVEMVQSYIENIINKQGEDRPGYVMINSPNPAIIGQLTEKLTQLYGSSSVINEPQAIQSVISSMPSNSNRHIQTTTEVPENSNNMPLFPFNSHYSRKSDTTTGPVNQFSHTDFIRQQLSSIASISVSSGTLINDTLDEGSIPTQKPTPIPVMHYNTSLLNLMDLPDSFPPLPSSIPNGNMSNSGRNNVSIMQTSTEQNTSNLTPTSNASSSKNQPNIQTNTTNENLSNNLANYESISKMQSQPLMDFPLDNSTHSNNVESNPPNFYQILGYDYELNTTGYEDYYEEIDGELVLSPTKFMRKTGPIYPFNQTDNLHPEHDNSERMSSRPGILKENDDDNIWQQQTSGQVQSTSGNTTLNNINLNAFLNKTKHFGKTQSYTTKPSYENSSILEDKIQYTYNTANGSTEDSNHATLNISSIEKLHNQEIMKLTVESTPNNTEHFTSTEIPHNSLLSGSNPQSILQYLMKMSQDDLKILRIPRNVTIIENYLHDKMNTTEHPNYTLLNINGNQIQARPNFSSAHFRQSDDSHFFPTQPSAGTVHRPHHHHHTSEDQEIAIPQLTPEQEEIISRLPVGMQHVVTSIVQAVQVPLQASTTTTSTTTALPQYPFPYPYPYPYPSYPYVPHINHLYPHAILPTISNSNRNNHNSLLNQPLHSNVSSQRNAGSTGSHGIQNNHNNHQAHGNPHRNHDDHGQHHHHHNENHQHNHNIQDPPHVDHHHHQNENIPSNQHHQHNPNIAENQRNPVSQSTVNHHRDHAIQNTQPHENHETHNSLRPTSLVNNANEITERNSDSVSNQHSESNEAHSNRNQEDTITIQNSVIESSTPPSSTLTPAFRPAVNPIYSQSRQGEISDDSASETENQNAPILSNNGRPCTGGICHNRINSNGPPSSPDRNQGLLQLQQAASHMGNGQQSNLGVVNFRPPAHSHMHMGAPVVNVVLPEATRTVTTEEPPLIEPTERATETQNNEATSQGMDREEMNSLLESLFSSPTLLLLGIIFAASAAYMAIAMEEQAVQQQFQQAQLAAAFGGQPFPVGRKRRHVPSKDFLSYLTNRIQRS